MRFSMPSHRKAGLRESASCVFSSKCRLCRMLAMSYSRRTFVFILPASASAPSASVQHIVPGQCKILEWTWTLCIQSQGGVSASPSLAAWQL